MALGIEKKNLLVVEGKEDEVFLGAFLKYIGLDAVQIIPTAGKALLRDKLLTSA